MVINSPTAHRCNQTHVGMSPTTPWDQANDRKYILTGFREWQVNGQISRLGGRSTSKFRKSTIYGRVVTFPPSSFGVCVCRVFPLFFVFNLGIGFRCFVRESLGHSPQLEIRIRRWFDKCVWWQARLFYGRKRPDAK